MKKIYGCIMLVILTLVDQFSKLFITRNFFVGEEREVIKNVFSIEYIRNTGAAWGMFPNGTIFFIIFSAIVCIGLLYLYFQIPKDRKYKYLSFVIITLVSGAIGNLIDRCFRKYVVDFFYFKLIDFPVFNVADIYVTSAAIVLIILIMFYYNHDAVEIILKAEDQSPFIEKLKTNSDVFGAGNMSPRRFVKDTYRNLSQAEQEEEIAYLQETKAMNDEMKQATMQSWTPKN